MLGVVGWGGNAGGTGGASFSGGVSGGNTSGNTGTVANQIVFAGGNNITLSGSTNAGGMSITVSGANAGGAQTGISGIVVSNTTYTSGTLTFQNANGISFGSSGANGISASYTVPVQSAQTGISAVVVSNTTYTSGTLTFQNANGISFGSSGANGISASYTVPIVQTGISGVVVSNTTYTSGTVTFQNANGISFGSSGANGVSASYTVPSQVSLFALGNTTQNSSSVLSFSALSFNGLGEVSVGFSNGSIQISVPPSSIGVSTGGNTSGNTGTYSGQLIFVGSNNITLSVGTAVGGAQTITMSGANILNVSGDGNSNALTGLTFQDSNGITFGLSTGASVGTLTASYNSTQFAGTGVTTGSVSSGASALTLNSNGISIVGPTLTRLLWPPSFELTAVTAPGNATQTIQYISCALPFNFTRIDALVAMSAGSAATSNTAAFAISAYACIYTKNVNSVSLQSVTSNSAQTTYSYASNTAGQTQLTVSAIRNISVPFPAQRLNPGEYYIGFNIVTATSSIGAATTSYGLTMSMMGGNALQSALPFADIGSNTATSTNIIGGMGIYSVATTGQSSPLHLSQINQTGTALSAANIALIFRNA